MLGAADKYWTLEEYWEFLEQAPEKYEYFRGQLFLMAGGTMRHAVISSNVTRQLGNQLEGKPCRAVGGELRVRVDAADMETYPDAMVFCPPFEFYRERQDVLLNPQVIVEVLSPSTANYDRGAKFDLYKQLPSLTDFLLIWQDRVRVDHFRRLENNEWLLRTAQDLDQVISIENVTCTLKLSDIYNSLEIPSGPILLRDFAPESPAE
jgi:Uma2 family endonuclease